MNDDHREFNNNTPNNEGDDFCAAVTLTCEGGEVNETNDGCVCTDPLRLFTQDTAGAEDDVCAAEAACGGGSVNNKNQCICPTAGHVAGDDGICSLPQNGNECREINPSDVYDPAAGSCASGCGNGRTADTESSFNCRPIVATDCMGAASYFDDDAGGAKGYVECRAPVTGEECRMRQGADAGSTEVYESEGAGCQDSCQGTRVEDDAHTCRDHGQDLCTPTEQIADGGVCRAPENGTECGTATGGARGFYNPRSTTPGDGDCVASCQGGGLDREVTDMNSNCRDRELRDCENNEYLDAADLTCKSPTNGAQCRMRKEVAADPANMDFLDGTVCRSSCTFDRRADGDGICQDPTEEQCAESDRYPNGSSCVLPTTGVQCAIAFDDAARNFYDTNRGGCTDSCSASREPRMENVCEDRLASDCMNDNDYIDDRPGQNRACTPAMTGAQCRVAKVPVSSTAVFEDGACATECRAGTDRQPALETFNCRVPTADDCRDLGQVPGGGDNCRDPMDGGECQGVYGNERRFFEDGSCVEQCSATHEARDQNACTPRDLDDCMDDYYLDEMNNNVCTRATNGLQCRIARNSPSTTDAVFEGTACAAECDTGRTASEPNYICAPTELSDCERGEYLNDDNECQASMDGNDCEDAQGFGPGAVFEDGACAASCRAGTDRQFDADRVCDSPSQIYCTMTDRLAVGDRCEVPTNGEECDTATNNRRRFLHDGRCVMACPFAHLDREGDGICVRVELQDCADGQFFHNVLMRCRDPRDGDDCRLERKNVSGNEGQFYDSEIGTGPAGCVASCGSPRMPDATHTCVTPLQITCSMTMQFAHEGACIDPRDGRECQTAEAGEVYQDGSCEEECDAGHTADEESDFNCEDTVLADCEDNEYLDAADLTCKAPTNGEQCRNRKEAASDPSNMDVLDGTACVDECSLDRREDANGICQDPTEAQCAETDMYPSGGNCVPPTTGTQCAIALDDSTMGFYNLETSMCTTACLPSQETRTGNVCENRDREDCDDGEYFNPPPVRTCIAPTNGVQCREARNGLGENAVFEDEMCKAGCDNDRQENTVFTCENPTEEYCAGRDQIVNGESCEDPDTGAECNTAYEGTRNVYDPDEGCLFECPASRERRERGICTDRTAEDCMEDGLYVNVSNERACETPTNGVECRMERRGLTQDMTLVYESEAAGGADCVSSCNGDRVPDAEFTCQELECPGMNQVPDGGMCDCRSGFADSDTSTPELTCTETPNCVAMNQELIRARNECGGCLMGFEDPDNAEPLECVPVCVDPAERQPDRTCAAPTTARTLADCADTQKLSSGECVPLVQSDCEDWEKFESDRCVLLTAGECPSSGCLTPPYGEYEASDCADSQWPWSIAETSDGLSELCHAPVRVLSVGPSPSSQQLRGVNDEADFCVLRGHSGEGYVRCDDESVFGSLGIPRAGNAAHLVTPITSAITLTLDDGSVRAAMSISVRVEDYLGLVQSSGSVIAVFDHGVEEAEITVTAPLVGSVSLPLVSATAGVSMTMASCADGEVLDAVSGCSAPDTGQECEDAQNRDFVGIEGGVCVLACSFGRTLNESKECVESSVPAPASGGGGGGGGGGGAAALIAVPVVLIGGYWLLGGFDYIDPAYDFSFSGENENMRWNARGGWNLRHGGFHSYAAAVQSSGDSLAYASGLSYEQEHFSLAYDAKESGSEYLYDLGARVKAEFGLWTIAPVAVAEFQYQREEDEWSSDAATGLMAAWTAHRWRLKAQSDFTGKSQHELDLELQF